MAILHGIHQKQELPFIAQTAGGCADTRLGDRVDLDCRPGWAVGFYPGDPTYPPVEGFDATETRFVLENRRWRPISTD